MSENEINDYVINKTLLLLDGNYIKCRFCERLYHNQKSLLSEHKYFLHMKNSPGYCLVCLFNYTSYAPHPPEEEIKNIEEIYGNLFSAIYIQKENVISDNKNQIKLIRKDNGSSDERTIRRNEKTE